MTPLYLNIGTICACKESFVQQIQLLVAFDFPVTIAIYLWIQTHGNGVNLI